MFATSIDSLAPEEKAVLLGGARFVPPFRVAVSLRSVIACHELAGCLLERGILPIAIQLNI